MALAVTLDRALNAAIQTGKLRGVAAAAVTPGATWVGAAGWASDERPMSRDTVVWIASMTKPVTAVGVMQLVESGVLDLDAPAGDLVPYLADVQVLDGPGPRRPSDSAPAQTAGDITPPPYPHRWLRLRLHRPNPGRVGGWHFRPAGSRLQGLI